MKSVALSIALLCNVAFGSVINTNGVVTVEWTADEMPDPRYDPESCGISTPGWFCDPDGVFTDRTFGGGPGTADLINSELWGVANTSECPCQAHDCYTHDVVILVAVVKKLKNPDGKAARDLLNTFAKQLQEDVWKADDTDCQQEIVVAMSVEDQAMTTEIGDDILRSKMMSYDDVMLVGGMSQDLNEPHNLVAHVKFVVDTYRLYVNHPPPADNETTPEIQPNTTNHQTVTSGAADGSTESPLAVSDSSLPPAIIAVIIIGVLIFAGAIAIAVLAPAVCRNEKLCLKSKR